MNIAISGGINQAFLGTSFETDDGQILNFGREDYLTSDDGQRILVRTVGSPDFKDTLELFLRAKISFAF